MLAFVVRQPMAEAIARGDKPVENRKTRPPRGTLGTRVAIVAGQAEDEWNALWTADAMLNVPDHMRGIRRWANRIGTAAPVPDAGMVVATALVVGVIKPPPKGWGAKQGPCPGTYAHMTGGYGEQVLDAPNSPWWLGPVGWCLADVRRVRPFKPKTRAMPGCFALDPIDVDEIAVREVA